MKLLISLFFLLPMVAWAQTTWLLDFDKAVEDAVKLDKMILLNFSGSDWCGPCIRMKKEIFDSDIFIMYARKNLVLVQADFPRMSKNQLSDTLIKHNEALAAKYNPEGKFPYTILMNAKKKILKSWIGYQPINPGDFVTDISRISDTWDENH